MDLSPAHENELIDQVLRDTVRVDPTQLRPMLRLAALGLVNSAWRNTCVEDWHAEGRLHDGDMLRINAQMNWRLDLLLWRWRAQMGISSNAPASCLDDISFYDLRWLGGRIYQWIVNPSRRLPTGACVRDVAGEDLPKLGHDADQALTAFVYRAEDRPTGFAFRWAAGHGGLACGHWWGHPGWPSLVDRFIHALDDPSNQQCGDSGEFRTRLPAEPAAIQDRNSLRRILLRQPWALDFASAQWIVAAGIGYLRHREHLP